MPTHFGLFGFLQCVRFQLYMTYSRHCATFPAAKVRHCNGIRVVLFGSFADEVYGHGDYLLTNYVSNRSKQKRPAKVAFACILHFLLVPFRNRLLAGKRSCGTAQHTGGCMCDADGGGLQICLFHNV